MTVRWKPILAIAVVGAALLVPGVAGAAPPPPPPAQDSVSLTDGPALTTHFTVPSLDATSGPSGENPSGQADFFVQSDFFPPFEVSGPVTCLAVSGNAATLNIQDEVAPFAGSIITVQVLDDQPDIFDSPELGRAPGDCSPAAPSIFSGPLTQGDITVVDAQPLPTSKDQCKGDGWRQFGFANQGLCVAFAERGPGS